MDTNTHEEEDASGVSENHTKERWLKRMWRTHITPLSRSEKVFLFFLSLFFLVVIYVALDANKYRATVLAVEGSGRVGVNPTTELLDFGDLSLGMSSVRKVTIKNGAFFPVFIIVVRVGDIASLINVSENFFTLSRGEESTIDFTTYMPASADVGTTYDGRIYIFRIPRI